MDINIENKLLSSFWDMPPENKNEIVKNILKDPTGAFQDEQIAVRALNSLNWYELIQLVGVQNLNSLLTEENINKLFPSQRRTYYNNAKRLLSKYSLPAAG